MAAVAVAASLSTCHFPLLLAINKARQGHKNSNSSSHNNNSNCIKWRKSRQMKLAADSSSFLALFKLLLQIKRAAKEANKNRRILRFSSRVCHDVFSLLSPHSWFPLSLSFTHRQTEMFPNYFSYNFICILLSQVANLELLFRQLLLASQTS